MSIKIGIIGAGGMTNFHIPGFIAGVQKEYGIKGIIFETENPALAGFMRKHFGFKSAGEKDYLLMFPEIN